MKLYEIIKKGYIPIKISYLIKIYCLHSSSKNVLTNYTYYIYYKTINKEWMEEKKLNRNFKLSISLINIYCPHSMIKINKKVAKKDK